MQFNQLNKNKGDVNNAISTDGNVTQSVGDRNKVQGSASKESFWGTAWSKLMSAWKWAFGK